MTPTGSFHGSNRLTCTMSGSFGSHAVLPDDLVHERRGQLEVLHRQRVDARRREHDAVHSASTSGTNSGIVHTDASYCSTNGWKNSNTCGFASVRSMWQRQIHFVLVVRDAVAARVVEHRRGLRVVDHDVVPLAFELQRVVEHPLEVDALHLRGPLDVGALQRVVHGLGDAKNSSLPWITCHSASMPTSRSSATWVASSSATPPPYAVAFTCSTRAPRSGSASARIRSSVPGSTTSA